MKKEMFPFAIFNESVDNYLLWSAMYFLELMNGTEVEIRSDVTLNELLLGGYGEDNVIAAFGLFQMNHGINIEGADYDLPLKDLISWVSTIPKLPAAEYAEYISRVTDTLKRDIENRERIKRN